MTSMFTRVMGSAKTGAARGTARPAGTKPPLAFALEPRFMFDAAGAATAADPAAADHAADPAAANHTTDHAFDRPQGDALATAAASAAAVGTTPSTAPPVEIRAADPALNDGRKEVAFIESSVADYQTLVDGVKAGIEVVLLDGSKDGLSQMAQWAQTHGGYDAVHIVSHGAEGNVYLGTTVLNDARLESRSTDLAAIGSALTDNGDLLLYGCDVAKGTDGLAFIGKLASLTGTDVAASSDTTGDAAQNGNWILERTSGILETASPFSSEHTDSYHHIMSTVTVVPGQNSTSVSSGDVGSVGTDIFYIDPNEVSNTGYSNGSTDTFPTPSSLVTYNVITGFQAQTDKFDFRGVASNFDIPNITFNKALTLAYDFNTTNTIVISAGERDASGVASNATTGAAGTTPGIIIAINDNVGTNYFFFVGNVSYNDLTLADNFIFASASAEAPRFTGDAEAGTNGADGNGTHDTGLTVAEDSGATNISALLAVSDTSTAGSQTLTWSVVSGPSHGTLGGLGTPYTATVTGGTVTPSGFTYTPTANYNGSDSFQIQVTDGVETDTVTVNVTVTSVNDAPTAVTLTATSINQSATGVNATVGTLGTTDVDVGDTHSYTLSGTNAASFNLSGGTLRTAGALAAGTYSITVRSTDSGSLFRDEAFTITVVDNVAPTVTSIDRLTPSSAATNADTLVFRVTFAEAVANLDATDFSVSGTTGTVTGVASAGGNAYDVTVSGGDLAGYNGTVTLSFAGGQNITDTAGNALAVTTPTGTNNPSYTLDNTAPGAPTTIDLADASDSGGANNDNITNALAPTLRVSLTGTSAVAGDTLELLLGGSALGTPRTKLLDGTDIFNGYVDFTIFSGDLGSDGSKLLTARVTDAVGNAGAAGGLLTLTLDATAPVLVISNGAALAYTEKAAATALDASATVTETGSPGLSVLTVQITANNEAADTLSIVTANGGGVWLDTSGNKVMNGATQIGTASAASVSNGTTWTITFLPAATETDIQGVVRAIQYSNSSSAPGTSDRTVAFNLTDGAGNAATTATRTVAVTAVLDPPTAIQLSGLTVSRYDVGTDVAVGTLTRTDADGGGPTYSIVSVNGATSGATHALFNIDNGTATLRASAPSTTTAGDYTVVIRVNDGTNDYDQSFTIKVENTLIVNVAAISGDAIDTYAVESADGGGLDLEEALSFANAASGPVTIQFAEVLRGSTITLPAGLTVRDGITFSFSDTTGSGTLTLQSNTLTLNGALTIDTGAGDTLVLSSVLSGSGSLIKTGTGSLTLSGATNSTGFSGGITVSGGDLAVNSDANLSTGTLTLDGGTLRVVSSSTTFTIDNGVVLGSGGGGVFLTANQNLTLSSAITGTGALTKTGGGTLTLSGTNSYSGGTTISGTNGLSVTDGGNLGSGTVTLNSKLAVTGTGTIGNAIALGAAATIDNTGAVTLSGLLSGSDALTKTGSGTLTLTGTSSTRTGATNVSAGTLAIASDANLGTANTATVSIASGATLQITGATTIDNAIDLTGVATIQTDADATLSGVLSGSGTLTKYGSGTLTLSGTSSTRTGATTVYAGTLAIASDASLGTANTATLTLDTGTTLRVTGATTIDNAIALSGAATIQTDDAVTISGSMSGSNALTKTGSGTLTLTSTSSTRTGATTVSAGTLAIASDASLGTSNTATVTLAAGTTLQITGATTIDNAIALSGAATIQTDAAVTLSGALSGGAQALTKSGSGTLTLSNTGNEAGLTAGLTVTAGTLAVADDDALVGGTVTLNGGDLGITGATTIDNAIVLSAAATITNSAAATLSGALSGSGTLTKAGAGTLTLSNTGNSAAAAALTVTAGTVSVASDNTLVGGAVTLNGGSLTITGATTIDNAIVLSAAATITNSAAVTLSGVLGGSGALTKAGSGTLTLTGTNTHSGSVGVNAGGLTLNGGSSIGDSSSVTVAAGATLTLAGGTETIGSLAGAGSVVLGYRLTIGENNTSTTFSGAISGSGNGITKTGTGTLTLTGNNTYTGATTVSAGTLAVSGSGTVGSDSAVTVALGATLSSSASSLSLGSLAGAGTVSFGANTLSVGDNNTSTSFSGTLSGSGDLYKRGTGTLTLSGSNSGSFTGTTTVRDGGGLSVADDINLGVGTVTLNGGTLTVTGSGATIDNAFDTGVNGATIQVGGSATLSGAFSGSDTLTKTGTGTLTLTSGTISHQGATTVSAGTLLLGSNALIGTSAVAVSSGATIGGTGTISNGLTIDSGGFLAPGGVGTVGELTVSGNLTLNGTLKLDIVSPSTHDRVAVGGTATLGANSAFDVADSSTLASNTFVVINDVSVNGVGGTLNGLSEGGTLTANGRQYTVSYVGGDGNDVALTALANPTVSSVSATTADGSYKAGDTISITVTFNRAVTVTGVPTLALGNNGRTATYSGGSGGTALTFTYTVQAGDTSADLDYLSTTALSGGTIVDTGTSLAATLTLAAPGAANSLGANKNIVIDTTAPGASSAPDMTAGSDTGASSTDNVTKTATPTFTGTAEPGSTVTLYDTDGTTVIGTGTANAITGVWSITPGTALTPGAHTVTATVTDAAGNVSGASPGLAITVDTTAPNAPSAPAMTAGSDTGASSSDGVTSTATPTFTGTAEPGSTVTLYDTDGTTVIGTGTADGSGTYSITVSALSTGPHSVTAKATDTAGNVSTTSGAQSVTIDTTAPTVSSVSATTADGTYKAGDTVTITVTFSEAVSVTGTPTLALNTGGTATYSGGSGTNTLTFTYTLASGQTAADLDYSSTGALAGTITDSAGNGATLTLPATGSGASLGGSKNIVIDTVGPAVTSVAVPADATYSAGQTLDFTVTFNEAVVVSGTPTLPITLDNGEVVQASYQAGSGGTTLTFRYTVGTGKLDANGIALGSALTGGTIRDTVGNDATLTLNSVAGTGGVRIDSVAPTVASLTASTADGVYTTGDTITIQVNFSEAVTVSGTPTLALNTGRTATYTGGSGGNTLTFTYTVQAGDTSADLDATGTGVLSGTIRDAAGNDATLTLPAPGAANSLGGTKNIVIDTTPPVIQSVAVPADGQYGVGKTLSISVRMSEVVTVSGGVPTILIDVGGVQRQAVYNPATSTGSVLRFDYVVQAGDTDADGITVGALSLNGATIADLARAPLTTAATATLPGVPGTQGVLIDTVAPAAPSAPLLGAGQDSGVSATDGLTNLNRPTVTGTAEPGSTVTVMVDGVAAGTATAGADGQWSYTFANPLADGSRLISSTATDKAGNVSPASPSLVLVIDATAPVLSTPGLAPGSDNGTSTTDRITGVTRPTLTGTAEANSTVSVVVDGTVVGTAVVGADGVWNFTVPSALTDGAHTVRTTATDRAGNTSQSAEQSFTVLTAPPSAPSAPVLVSAVDSGASSGDGLTNVAQPVLGGTALPNGTVTVYVDGTAVGTARTDSGGAWSLTLSSPLAEGVHQVRASVTDAVGNVGTALSDPLTITVDTRGPSVSVAGTPPRLTAGETVSVGSGVSLSDANTLDRVTITLIDGRAGDDLVIGALPAGITAARDGNRIVLSGVASVADYQTAMRAIGLRSSATDPSFAGVAPNRSFTISARDAAGNDGTVATLTIPVASQTAPNTATTPSPTITLSTNGPSTNTSSGSNTTSASNGPSGGTGSFSAPSLPGGGSQSDGGLPGGSSSTDAGRSVTLNSVGGSSSTDAGRSVTLNSVGNASSADAGRSVTLNSVGGQSVGGSSSSSSGLSGGTGTSGSSGGRVFGGGFNVGLGGGPGGGLGSLFGGVPGLPNGTRPGAGTPQAGTGPVREPGSQPAQGGNANPDPAPQGNAPQGNAPAGDGQLPPADQGPADPAGGADAPVDGSAPRDAGTGNRAAAPVERSAPGFAHQVARAHGAPSGASALLAALANHVLPGNRAA